jgi:H+/Na+-translocating ferredoxin:NAD+ oxidoreductase subunit G
VSAADPLPPSPDPEAAAPKPVSSARLALTLGGAGALAGLLLVWVYQITQPAIQAHKAAVLRAAILEVLGDPDGYDTLYVQGGRLVAKPPAGVDAAGLERVWVGRHGDGSPAGFAVAAEGSGYQDVVRLIFGYDAGTHKLIGMKVLESKETPGLGDRIEKDPDFLDGFPGAEAPLEGVKAGEGRGDPHAVDTITGATISSRTVIRIINQALKRLGPALETWSPEGPR